MAFVRLRRRRALPSSWSSFLASLVISAPNPLLTPLPTLPSVPAGILYGVFCVIEVQECGSAFDPMCASSYGIAAGAIFFALAILYLCGKPLTEESPALHTNSRH